MNAEEPITLPDPFSFNFEGNEQTIFIDKDNLSWWVLNKVAKVLGIVNSSDIIKRLNPDHYIMVNIPGKYGNPIKTCLINEPGLYSVIFRSDKPNAVRFQNWVFESVLPSIRKTGMYSIQQDTAPVPQFKMPQTFLEALELCVDLEKQRLALEEENKAMLPKAQYYDAVIDDENTWSINDVSKMLGIKDFGMLKLFEHLRSQGILMWNNMPYQQYMNNGYFKVVQVLTKVGTKPQTRVTQRGVDFIIRNLVKNRILKGAVHAEISGGKLALSNPGRPASIGITSTALM